MKLSFHGAAGGVTGSCFLLEIDRTRILIDCGMYQGGRGLHKDNLKPFGFNPKNIDILLLTHAHLDHCGRIPLLVKRGFRGEIITTRASRELAKLVMLDSARVNEEEAKRESKYLKRNSKKKNKAKKNGDLILYNTLDVLKSLDYFSKKVDYEERIKLTRNIYATFYDAGHIIGSSSIVLEVYEGNKIKQLLFSGDIGTSNKPIIRDPVIPSGVDYVVMETTYGGRIHKSIKQSVEELYSAINDTFNRGGNVFIPTFALERAQELLFFLREGLEKNKLPRNMQVFLDSPMAISATEIYKEHPECFDDESLRFFNQKKDPFDLPNLRFVRDSSESIAINHIKSGAIVMAGSGMCNGGRIMHHLKHNLWREECGIIFVSFAAIGTLARNIIDGAKTVKIFGESIDVKAKTYTINGFSAHAGHDELIKWHKKIGSVKKTFLIHGDPEAMIAVEADLKKSGNKVEIPRLSQIFEL